MLLNHDTVLDIVYLTVRETTGDSNTTLTPEARLTNDLGIDSLDQAEIIVKLEREFPTANFGLLDYFDYDELTLSGITDFICKSAEQAETQQEEHV